MKKQGRDPVKLKLWQDRMGKNKTAFTPIVAKMSYREELYLGTHAIKAVDGGKGKPATHVRNLVAELIEAQIDGNIPAPKVTARRQEDELLAKKIEDMLRNEIDRMEFELLNDLQERTTPIQGGSLFLCEWDNSKRTHSTVGELAVSLLHPRQLIPQDGVYTGIDDMDYIIVAIPQTKHHIKQKYGVTVEDEQESDPEVKGNTSGMADEMVTQYMAYYRNDNGSIGLFSWVNDVVLADYKDYQLRRLSRCNKCGEVGSDTCHYCGSKSFTVKEEHFEELTEDIVRSDGSVIPATTQKDVSIDGLALAGLQPLPTDMYQMEPTKIPFYKPNLYPIVLRNNVSVFGQLLGDSDVDKIEDQQNAYKKLSTKITEKLLKGGSYVTMPADCTIDKTDGELKIINLTSPNQAGMIRVINVQPDVSVDMTYQRAIYEEARQTIGITDSFLGRRDTTATSGKAKEFAAAQAAGRLASKRTMKDRAYAKLFEIMFKFKLAFADEERPLVSKNASGGTEYSTWNRYDFLAQDAAGDWHWKDEFLFSCDATAPLAGNREAMWQETRMNLQTGAFGDTSQLPTQILFWTKMAQLHYPGAGDTKTYLEEMLAKQEAQAAQSAAAQTGQQTAAMPPMAQPPLQPPQQPPMI